MWDLAGNYGKSLEIRCPRCRDLSPLSQELSIDVRNQEVETMKIADAMGVGLRVIKDGRMGFSLHPI